MTIDPRSTALIEKAVAIVGEKHRDTVQMIYRLGHVDGELAASEQAYERMTEKVAA